MTFTFDKLAIVALLAAGLGYSCASVVAETPQVSRLTAIQHVSQELIPPNGAGYLVFVYATQQNEDDWSRESPAAKYFPEYPYGREEIECGRRVRKALTSDLGPYIQQHFAFVPVDVGVYYRDFGLEQNHAKRWKRTLEQELQYEGILHGDLIRAFQVQSPLILYALSRTGEQMSSFDPCGLCTTDYYSCVSILKNWIEQIH